MVDDVQDNLDLHQQKGGGDTVERVRAVRERREAEQRRRLDELRAHAAAAQAQRDAREAERRRRSAEQRAREDDRRNQVEERKRAIWEAGVSRREALLRRDREREERVERQRAARSCGSRTNVFAFGSSTPRMLEPADTGGIFWGHRSTNPLDQMSFFESLASSTSNVMFSSAPLTRRSSTFDLDRSERDKKDESSEQTPPAWSSVARRRTDLVPTIPAPRPPGRAYSMTRLDRLQPQRAVRGSPSMSQLVRNNLRSGETTPGSRPGSAMSQSTPRRPATARRPRPASVAGTPRGAEGLSVESTPPVSRDATSTSMSGGAGGAGGDVPRRPATARRPRPVSMHVVPTTPTAAGDGKPPLHRKPKLPKELDKTPRGGRSTASPSDTSKEPTPARDIKLNKPIAKEQKQSDLPKESNQVNAAEVTQKLEALQLKNKENQPPEIQTTPKQTEKNDNQDVQKSQMQNSTEPKSETAKTAVAKAETPKLVELKADTPKVEIKVETPKAAEVKAETPKVVEVKAETPRSVEQKKEEKVVSQEKTEETDMSASMIARRITTEEEAKAALAERRRKAREELERQAELERQRLAAEAEAEAERQRQEEERQRQLEEEARELAELRRRDEEEKLKKAIEAQQQLEREARERAARETAERVARAREEEEERGARERAAREAAEQAEREEAERRARRQRVEAIMLRTRQKKAEEDKKQQENKTSASPDSPVVSNNATQDITLNNTAADDSPRDSTPQENTPQDNTPINNGNTPTTGDLLGLSDKNTHIVNTTINFIEAEKAANHISNLIPDKIDSKSVDSVDLLTSNVDLLSSNVDIPQSNVDLLSAHITEVKSNGESKEENGYTIHNGHKENNGMDVLNNGSSQYPLTLHNAV